MDVSYNLGQLIICLETWLGTHEKKFNKKNLKTKKFVAAHVGEKTHVSKHISSTTNQKLMKFGLPRR
jgi:hypothetical protein